MIFIDNDEDFIIQSSQLKSDLQLTTADLRFTQLFEDENAGLFYFVFEFFYLKISNLLVIKSEEEIRRLFTNYLLSLLSVARTPSEFHLFIFISNIFLKNKADETMNDFNSSFVKSFQLTNAFRLWQSKGPYPHFDQIIPRFQFSILLYSDLIILFNRHPQAGQLHVSDVKLRVAQ